jgi:hypothetical protein
MRSAAPAVRYLSPSGDAAWRRLQRVLAAVAGATLGAWAASWLDAAPPVVAAAAAAMAACLAWAMGATLGPPGVDLAWDGGAWLCDGQAGTASLHIDLGTQLLVRFQPDRPGCRVRWLGLSRRGAPQVWHAVRVALHATPPSRAVLPAASLAA